MTEEQEKYGPGYGTHWDECWREHHGCAVARIEQLKSELEEATKDAAFYKQLADDLEAAFNESEYLLTECEADADHARAVATELAEELEASSFAKEKVAGSNPATPLATKAGIPV